MSEPLSLKAYAKVNLGLDVVRRRDDGYHEVRMIMQTIRLFDRITLQKNSSGKITLSTNLPYLPVNEHNLVYRAIDIMRRHYHIKDGIHADISKRIPVAAGMAGGSTDAAAAFVGMNQMFELGISQDTLMKYAVSLGADIPFCIMRGTALSEGIGELLTPLAPMPECWFLVVKPVFSMSTKYVYENLVLNQDTIHPDIDGMVEALDRGDLKGITSRMGNVLEQVTRMHYPDIEKIKDCMREFGAEEALMSGSGSTVFGVFINRGKAEKAADACRSRFAIRQVAIIRPFNKPASVSRRKIHGT